MPYVFLLYRLLYTRINENFLYISGIDNDNDQQVVIIAATVAAFVIVGLAVVALVYCLTMKKSKR